MSDKLVEISFVTRSWTSDTGRHRRIPGGVRVIKEGPANYRIDKTEAVAGAWLPWEPIDTTVYPTRDKALAAIRRWAKANGVTGGLE